MRSRPRTRLRTKNIASIFTHLGENIRDAAEAARVAEHYIEALRRIREQNLNTEISVKPTQLGLDLILSFATAI